MTNDSKFDPHELLSVLSAIERGDFSRKMASGQEGIEGQIAETLNSIIEKLNGTASEVSRITREIGQEGRFGGQAVVPNLEGGWEVMVQSTNTMARNLTDQFRNIALVTTCIANGDFGREVTVGAQGEVEELKRTMNLMRVQLHRFAYELSRIAREIGTDGMFGGQAELPTAAGKWKELIQEVNAMSASLTCQIRDFARTSRGVALGRPSQRATVDARGETLELKEILNAIAEKATISPN
jgi:HAMP domain-containing protein